MVEKGLICFLFFICLVVPIVSADVISLNSGGSEVIVINPDNYIEGFFTGDVPYCGDGVCNSNETCASCSFDCACTVGYTCTLGVCVADPVGDSSSSGGAPGAAAAPSGISVSPTELNVNLAVNTNKKETITVTNLEANATTVSVSESGLGTMVILGETSLTIPAGESRQLDVVFVAFDRTGIFTGKIIIGSEEVLVALNIKTQLLLFDSNIVVLNKDYKVELGKKLKTQVTLIPMGDEVRLDVILNYEIKDYAGKTYLTKSETLLVEEQVEFKRDFDTGILPLGKYVVGLELVYSNGVAPSSAHFEVVKGAKKIFGLITILLILAILAIIILIIVIIVRRRKEKEQEEIPGG